MPDLSHRAHATELMDDLTRPAAEFDDAYRELQVINRRLGGVRAVARYLPRRPMLSVLDVAAGGCDVGEALLAMNGDVAQVVSLDIHPRGLKRARRSLPVQGDAMQLPFTDEAFDVVACSLTFHHLTDDQCLSVLREMWRVARNTVIVNDLHRHRAAYIAFRLLSRLFSKSVMVRHDGPVSILRALRPAELMDLGRRAGLPCEVHRSFPYRIVLVAGK